MTVFYLYSTKLLPNEWILSGYGGFIRINLSKQNKNWNRKSPKKEMRPNVSLAKSRPVPTGYSVLNIWKAGLMSYDVGADI